MVHLNLEDYDSLTWAVASFVSAILCLLSHVDYLGSILLLCLVGGAFALSLRNKRPTFRSGAGNGIVCGLVAVPAALAALDSPMFHTALIVALIMCVMFLASDALIPSFDYRVDPLVPLGVSVFLGYIFGMSLVRLAGSVAVSLWTLTILMMYAPGSFSLGEFFMVSTLSSLPVYVIVNESGIPRFSAIYVLFGIVCLTLALVLRMPLIAFVMVIPVILTVRDIPTVIVFIFDFKRIMLLVFCGLMCGAFLAVSMRIDFSKYPVTVQRKYFHLMALLVFVPPVLFDYEFFRLCICGAIFVFLFMESLRIVRFPYLAGWIEQYVSGFLDDRDAGELILTHLFLLLGLGLPVLLCGPDVPGALSVHICGVCVLAIGDATASVIGVTYGKHKWPGSKKSYEGTAGAFIGTWLSLLIIEQFKTINMWPRNLLGLAIPAAVGALDEAFTSQIDNLTLPFVMMPFIVFVKRFL